MFLRAVRLMSLLLIQKTQEGSLRVQMTWKAADLIIIVLNLMQNIVCTQDWKFCILKNEEYFF